MLDTKTKVAIAAAVQGVITAIPRLAGRSMKVKAKRLGINWLLDLDEGFDFSIWLLGAFERRTVAAYSRIVTPGMTVVDIGANIGAHALPLARLAGPDGHVHAIEPTAWAVDKLRTNLRLNPELAACITVHQAMIVGHDGDALPGAIYSSWPLHERDVHPKLRAQAKSTDGACAITLDALVAANGIAKVDFIKLDVDGYECEALRGGAKTLTRDHPTIILELSPYLLAEAGANFDDLLAILYGAGYTLYDLSNRKTLPRDPAVLAQSIPAGGSINAIARQAG